MNVAQTSSLWGDRAFRLVGFLIAGWKPACPTGSPQDESVRLADKMPVLRRV